MTAITMSADVGDIMAAIAQAQAACEIVEKTRDADLGRAGRYRYADLATVLAAVRPAYAAAGVAIVQGVQVGDGYVTVTTTLGHTSGQWISSDITMPCGDARPQSVGSAITYARRYAIQAMCCVAAEDDDDGATAQVAATARQTRESPHRERFGALVRQCQHAIAELAGETPSFAELCERAKLQWPDQRDDVTDRHYLAGIAALTTLRAQIGQEVAQ